MAYRSELDRRLAERTPIAPRIRDLGLLSRAGLATLATFLSACSYRLPAETAHVLAFAKDGLPVEERVDVEELEAAFGDSITPQRAYDEHVERIRIGLSDFHSDPDDREKPILVYLHGGLNSYEDAYSRAEDWLKKGDPQATPLPAYPIFVCWHSDLWSSYADHVFFVRQGRNQPVMGSFTWPVFLVADLGRSLLRAPFVWAGQIGNFCSGFVKGDEVFDDYGADCRPPLEVLRSGVSYGLTLPVKIVGTIFVDTLGTSAWEMMLRRTRLLFAPEDPSDGHELVEPRAPFVRFLNVLARYQGTPNRKNVDKDILIAHSMGAIVANRMLRLAVARPDEFPRFHTIVYVAPACSVSDCLAAIVPYLRLHSEARFRIIGLHPDAEKNETYAFDLAPRGSLLDWLDQFLDKPLTPHDRVIGKLENLIPARVEFGDELSARIDVAGGDFGCGCEPASIAEGSPCRCTRKQTHGGLAECVLEEARNGKDFASIGREIATCEVQAAYAADWTSRLETIARPFADIAALEDALTHPDQSELRATFLETIRLASPALPAPIREELTARGDERIPLDRWIEQIATARASRDHSIDSVNRSDLRDTLGRLLRVSTEETRKVELEAAKHRLEEARR